MTNYLCQTFGLEGKRAVVTGAGRGIGRAIAEALAGAGAEVIVHYNQSKEAAQKVVEGINAWGGKAFSECADLTDSQKVKDLFQKIADRWRTLDILVNNSGNMVKRVCVEDFTDDLLEQVLRVNFHTTVYCSRAAIPLLKRGKEPSIVNVGSVAAHRGGGPGAAIYASAKGAIQTLTRSLARELAPEIRVNAVAPGVIYTDFNRIHSTEEHLKSVAKQTALARLGEAEDIGAAVVYLCSKGASFVTGEIIEINGGYWFA